MAHHGIHRTAEPSGSPRAIPDKLYFRIGDVAKLCAVPAYVLRFWESEFPQLKPNKGGTGQRLYRRRDVETALRIKALLYDEGFTIPGARQALKTEQRQKEPQLTLAIVEGDASPQTDRHALRQLQREMKDLLKLLATPRTTSTIHTLRPARPAKGSRGLPSTPDSQPLFD